MRLHTGVIAVALMGFAAAGLVVAMPEQKPGVQAKVPVKQSVTKVAEKVDGKGEEQMQVTTDYRTIPFKTITGNDSSLAEFKGKVVLIVNTASECGNTPQYADLEKIYEKYKDRGFVVVGFPANNFGKQEPGTDKDIARFCSTQYKVTFPMMSKVSVKGMDIHPLFAYLTEKSPLPGEIKWNFGKFLLDKNGDVVARYEPKLNPQDSTVVSKIESLL